MKQTIKLGIILVILLSLLCFAGCSIDTSDYSVASYNIVWTECEGEIGTDYLPTRVYYQIDGISTKQYIGCKYRDSGIGADEYPVLMKHKKFENSFEFKISSAKLIISKSGRNFSDEEWRSFGDNITVQVVHQIDNPIAEQLANSIIVADYLDYDDIIESGIHFDSSNYICDGEGNYLRLQFTLKDYDTLIWIAYVLKHDGTYYIEINEDISKTYFLLCSDEFASIIDKVCNEHDLN